MQMRTPSSRSCLQDYLYGGPEMEQFPQQPEQLSGDMPYPNPSSRSDIYLNTYAYCFDRGNGQYTRLIPADMLPPLKNIPALQQDCSRMIVLPLPQALPPSTTETADSRNALPRVFPPDAIQSRIDTIVAATSPTASAHRPRDRDADANASQSQRRHKIYCDKWVHEGVCAFTQQGCKYKHEMPFDKWTQHQLGLFHGFPTWWKKHAADVSRQRDVPVPSVGATAAAAAVVAKEPRRLRSSDWFMTSGGRAGEGGDDDSGSSRPASAATSVTPAEYANNSAMDQTWRCGSTTKPKSLRSDHAIALRIRADTGNKSFSHGLPFGPIQPPSGGSSTAGKLHIKTESAKKIFPGPQIQAHIHQQRAIYGINLSVAIPTTNPYALLGSLDNEPW